MIGFAFCHGWSFDAQSLAPLREELARRFPHAPQASFDLGFTCAPRMPALAPDTTWVAVGHSYGFAWLMQQPQAWHAAVAINGFTRFCRRPGRLEGAPVRRIDAMLAGLEQETHAVVAEFQAHCRAIVPIGTQFDSAALANHLRQLRDLDLSLPDLPVLALAAAEDIVVPRALAHACFSGTAATLREFPGDHLDMLKNPAEAVQAIAEFIEAIHA